MERHGGSTPGAEEPDVPDGDAHGSQPHGGDDRAAGTDAPVTQGDERGNPLDAKTQLSDSAARFPVPDDISISMGATFPGPVDLMTPASPPEEEPALDGREVDALRRTTLKGGAYLAVREMVGMGIRFLGVVIVTRQIGPHAFGTYSGAAAFIAVAVLLSQMGMEIYLIRQPKEPSKRDYDEVFTFIAALSAIVVLAFLGLSVLYVHIRPSAGSSINVFRLLLISVPLNALWAPAQARIERSFGFRNMAILELGGDVTLYLVAASLALFGWGAYSLVVAVIAWQAWILVGSYRMARMFPRLRLPNRHWRNFMKHGAAYSSSSVGGMFANLTNPIVVGRSFGATGVGYVALASRLVDTVAFAQRATWRLGLVALSKVQSDPERTRRGIEEGMVLQVLMVSIPMCAVAVTGRFLIPLIFGPSWHPVLGVFALLGVASILNAPLTVQMALLYSRARNQPVVLASLLNLALLFGSAWVLVPMMGINGYGVAMIIGTLGWIVLYVQARRIQDFNSLLPLPWLAIFVPVMFFPLAPMPEAVLFLLPLVPLVAVRHLRDQLVGYIRLMADRVRATRA